jgi:hypothetical protein
VTFYGAFVAANGNGTNSGDQVFLSSLLATENLSAGIAESAQEEWSVYPNPARDRVTLGSSNIPSQIIDVTIYDITGKQVKIISQHELSQDKSIDIADLQSGMYVLTIRSEAGTSSRKIIKR